MTDTLSCPDCAASMPAEMAWCEACGADLGSARPAQATPGTQAGANQPDLSPTPVVPPPGAGMGPVLEPDLGSGSAPPPPPSPSWSSPCVSCDAQRHDVSADGWCTICGQRQPTQQDHAELDEGRVAAVTDRGLRHHRNEDAVAIASRDRGAMIVVCDGVSSTEFPDQGAKAACDAALAVLVERWDARYPKTAPAESSEPPEVAGPAGASADSDFDGLAPWMEAATAAANDAVAAVIANAGELRGEPPSCTMVALAARIVRDQVTVWVAWLGDSRAYWVHGLDGQLLTVDHSWAALEGERGELDADEIAADPRANSITRWIGPDSPNSRAEVRRFDFAIPGRFIVCTDGLWRYAESAPDMALRSAEAGDAPMDAARNLADLALTSGGHDNISVAVFDAGMVRVLEATPAQKE